MATVATLVLLVPTAEVSDGMFNVAGYELMGLVAAGFIFTAITVSALGTHSLIQIRRRRRKDPLHHNHL